MSATSSEPDYSATVEGHSFSLPVRICGLGVFLLIPMFAWIWIDDPQFVEGVVDGPEMFMAIVTVGMVLLGIWGSLINFSKTRVTADAIEWGIICRHHLPLSEISERDLTRSSSGPHWAVPAASAMPAGLPVIRSTIQRVSTSAAAASATMRPSRSTET